MILFLNPRNTEAHRIEPVDKLTAITRLTRENIRATDPRREAAAGRAFEALTNWCAPAEFFRPAFARVWKNFLSGSLPSGLDVLNQTHSLLLALADPRGPASDIDLAPPEPEELRRLLELADQHGALAIVMENLKQLSGQGNGPWNSFEPDPAAWEWAQQQLRRRMGLSLVLRQQAQELTSRMQETELPVIVLKGCDFFRSPLFTSVVAPVYRCGPVDS